VTYTHTHTHTHTKGNRKKNWERRWPLYSGKDAVKHQHIRKLQNEWQDFYAKVAKYDKAGGL